MCILYDTILLLLFCARLHRHLDKHIYIYYIYSDSNP